MHIRSLIVLFRPQLAQCCLHHRPSLCTTSEATKQFRRTPWSGASWRRGTKDPRMPNRGVPWLLTAPASMACAGVGAGDGAGRSAGAGGRRRLFFLIFMATPYLVHHVKLLHAQLSARGGCRMWPCFVAGGHTAGFLCVGLPPSKTHTQNYPASWVVGAPLFLTQPLAHHHHSPTHPAFTTPAQLHSCCHLPGPPFISTATQKCHRWF